MPIPWLVALALQADGWYLRRDVIWNKPNPMPESVTDRPTSSHEYLFLLSKRSTYFYDADAVREPSTGQQGSAAEFYRTTGRREGRASLRGAPSGNEAAYTGREDSGARNLRSVWTVATQPYPGAHFATFPEALIEPCIKAGTSERGVCGECGKPWRRIVEREHERRRDGGGSPAHSDLKGYSATSVMRTNALPMIVTTGWQPSCTHDAIPVPATVLDPFAGSGTTGRVAQRLGRRAILIDLNADYLRQAMVRNQDIPLGLTPFSGDSVAVSVATEDEDPAA